MGPEGTEGICENVEKNNCNDEIDNDGDGKIDCCDPNCNNDPFCQDLQNQPDCSANLERTCNDGIDNNQDGRVDCADTTCIDEITICGSTCEDFEVSCSDEVDNDGDGHIDCNDDDCADDQFCFDNARILCADEEGFIDCEDPACSQDPICTETGSECSDFDDNDSDGLIDCEDPDCFGEFGPNDQPCGATERLR
jgi:hypothetical protein